MRRISIEPEEKDAGKTMSLTEILLTLVAMAGASGIALFFFYDRLVESEKSLFLL